MIIATTSRGQEGWMSRRTQPRLRVWYPGAGGPPGWCPQLCVTPRGQVCFSPTWAGTTGSLPSPRSRQIQDPRLFPLFQLTDHLRFGKLKSYSWGSKWDVVVSEWQERSQSSVYPWGSGWRGCSDEQRSGQKSEGLSEERNWYHLCESSASCLKAWTIFTLVDMVISLLGIEPKGNEDKG